MTHAYGDHNPMHNIKMTVPSVAKFITESENEVQEAGYGFKRTPPSKVLKIAKKMVKDFVLGRMDKEIGEYMDDLFGRSIGYYK